MSYCLSATRIDATAADWPAQLREMRRRLAGRPTLLPHHFLEVVLPKVGGALFALERKRANAAASLFGYAFLLPRDITDLGAVYTLRYEQVDGAPGFQRGHHHTGGRAGAYAGRPDSVPPARRGPTLHAHPCRLGRRGLRPSRCGGGGRDSSDAGGHLAQPTGGTLPQRSAQRRRRAGLFAGGAD